MSKSPGYVLTPWARAQFRKEKAWSRKHWGREQTQQYFEEIAALAERLSEEYPQHRPRRELSGGSGLRLFPVREHYLVYEPLENGRIAIMDFFRQSRNTIAILSENKEVFAKELQALRTEIQARKENIPPG